MISGFPVQKHLKRLEKLQWYSPSEIDELQNEKLRNLIKHTYENVPFYQRLFKQRKLVPADIKSIQDLPKLSVITKEMIKKARVEEIIARNFKQADLIIASSSGSTGEPIHYYITKENKAQKWASLFLIWKWAGYDFGKKYASLTVSPNRVFKNNGIASYFEGKLMRQVWIEMYDIAEAKLEEHLQTIEAFSPEILRAYSSTIYFLARCMQQKNRRLKLNAIITTGETLFPEQRALIEDRFQCRVFDGYGTEGMTIAAECDRHTGYHINPDNVVLEIIQNQGSFSEGRGEMVVTNLNNWAMPFIRYNTEDVAGWSKEQACSCGRKWGLLSSIEGRLADFFRTPDGRLLSVHHFTGLFMHIPSIEQFQVVQKKMDLIVVRIKKNDKFSLDDNDKIIKAIKGYLGYEIKVEFEYVEAIQPTPAGKRRFFISEILN